MVSVALGRRVFVRCACVGRSLRSRKTSSARVRSTDADCFAISTSCAQCGYRTASGFCKSREKPTIGDRFLASCVNAGREALKMTFRKGVVTVEEWSQMDIKRLLAVLLYFFHLLFFCSVLSVLNMRVKHACYRICSIVSRTKWC